MMRIAKGELEALVAAALSACGASEPTARITARYLTEADAQGLTTHGTARVATYCGHLKSGRARGDAVPRVVNEKLAAFLVDAGNGLGFWPCEYALEIAVRRARAHGVSFAGITNSHHCGALGILLEPVAASAMIGLAFSNASAAIMPWGGKHPLYGTNPVAAVFPRAAAAPLVIDMSLTQVTRGEIMLRANRGEAIPEGWGMDKDGSPTTDAQQILVGGSLHAVGGLKGTMLALAVELLCCALTGAALSHEVASIYLAEGPPMRLGQAFLVIDPAALPGRESYLERVETLVAAMMDDEGVRLPGARRAAAARAAIGAGIEVDDVVIAELERLALR